MGKVSYLFGYAGGRKTLAEMERSVVWGKVHPELRRRALALMDDCPHDLGVGNAFRSAAQQEATFRSRYTPFPTAPGIVWQGKYWRHTSGAPSAPPGLSYHEESTPDGWGLAIDFLNYDPAIPWANAHAAQYGLEHLADYAGERWHFQPIEVPRSRRNYNVDPARYPLAKFPLPGDTTDPDPTDPEDDDMKDDERASLKKIEEQVQRLSEAVFVDNSVYPNYPSLFNMFVQVRTWVHAIATKLGVKTD